MVHFFIELLDYLYDVIIIMDSGIITNLTGGAITNKPLKITSLVDIFYFVDKSNEACTLNDIQKKNHFYKYFLYIYILKRLNL